MIYVDHETMVAHAQQIGCQLECVRFNQQPDRWYWSYGTHVRSSNDHYGRSFNSAAEAAQHFLESREGQAALRRVNK